MFYGYGFDPTFIVLLPAMLFAIYAQSKVSSTFNKYLRVGNLSRYTGYQVARKILDDSGLYNIPIEMIGGKLSDHYDPRSKVLRLSNEVYNGTSVASIGVAAHECGHAIQHDHGYIPLTFRNLISPIASFGSQAAWFFVFAGFIFRIVGLIDIGIALFSAAVVFQIVTLPVEFNASSRAIVLLESNSLITTEEITPIKKVLNAAALTYVAATVVALAQLLRLLLIRGRRD